MRRKGAYGAGICIWEGLGLHRLRGFAWFAFEHRYPFLVFIVFDEAKRLVADTDALHVMRDARRSSRQR